MTDLIPPMFEDYGFRAGLDGDDLWVAAPDVAAILGHRMASDMTRSLDDDVKGTRLVRTPGGEQETTVLTEAGLYQAIMQRQSGRIPDEQVRERIRRFQRWVTHEVLPAIRKTGSYSTAPALPQSYADALRELAATVEQREALAAKVEQDAPKVLAFEQYMTAEGDYSMDAAAKMLSDVTGGLGRNKLFAWLRERKVLMTGNRPYQAHAHLFRVIASTYEDRNGTTHTTYTTYVRPQGVEAIRRWFSKAVVG